MTFEESLTPKQRANRNAYEEYLRTVVQMNEPSGYLETISGSSKKIKNKYSDFSGNIYDYDLPEQLAPFYDPIMESKESKKLLNGNGNNTNSTPFRHYMEMLRARALFSSSQSQMLPPQSHDDYPAINISCTISSYLKAIKAKPFLILGGFSGTGKSQSVKELAYITCPDINGMQSDPQMPGNYCLVSVKPNWHDSSDLLGFYSSINDKYELTGFIRFLVKAMQNPSVPFFACIDEMNLAPVEEYFAEYLSVLESRSYNPATNQIESATLLEKDIFTKAYKEYDIFKELGIEENSPVATLLKAQGLRLPQNVVVIGTVNMDDTTHSFSRKVIDRAMTFETNIIDFTPDVYATGDNMHYVSDPKDAKDVLPLFASAKDALKQLEENGIDTRKLMEDVTGFVNSANTALKGSPFQISYRVLNETILYYYSYGEGKEVEKIENVFNDILMMKVLPRIEGDQDKAKDALEGLLSKFDDAAYTESRNKITEMLKPFGDGGSGFTTFWN